MASSLSSSTLTITAVQNLIAATPASSTISVIYKENLETKTAIVTPRDGIVAGKPAIGISMSEIGIVKLNPFSALYYGTIQTYNLAIAIGTGLAKFIGSIFIGKANFKEVSGPVGIAGVVGQASRMGFSYLITITAIISVNLAAINLVPFPALDGGRLLVVGIEAIIRRPLKASAVNAINIVGFGFLIILMLVVTFKDILKLFH